MDLFSLDETCFYFQEIKWDIVYCVSFLTFLILQLMVYFKRHICIAMLLALQSCFSQNTKTYQVKAEEVSQTMAFLTSDALMGRDTGSEGIALAATYLENELQKNGVKPYFSSYRDTLSNHKEVAFNVVGFLEGNDPVLKNEFVIIGAHYDHIGIAQRAIKNDSIVNGANDNASGSTAVLEMAKYFGQQKNNQRSMLFVFFSAEEKGLLGSRHLAEKLKKQNFNLYTMLNFEMIGVPMKKSYTAYITGYKQSNMADKLNEYAGKNVVGFHGIELQYNLFRASDNFPFFLEFHVPSQTVCTFDFENYEYYHHPYDEFSRMDIPHMTSFIQEMIPAVKGMTNAKTKEIKLKK